VHGVHRSAATKRGFSKLLFQIGLCSSHSQLWSWTWGNDRKSAIRSTSGRDGIFAKSSRSDKVRDCEIRKALNVAPKSDGSITWTECPKKVKRFGEANRTG